jgi:hypothetical protein
VAGGGALAGVHCQNFIGRLLITSKLTITAH